MSTCWHIEIVWRINLHGPWLHIGEKSKWNHVPARQDRLCLPERTPELQDMPESQQMPASQRMPGRLGNRLLLRLAAKQRLGFHLSPMSILGIGRMFKT